MTAGLDQMKKPNKMSAQNKKKKKKNIATAKISLPTILVLYIMCVGQLNKNI